MITFELIDLDGWAGRIQNALDIQKDLSLDMVDIRLSRVELVELKLIIGLAREMRDKRRKE